MNGKPIDGLTRRDKWPRYAAGMLTETAFILGLTILALGLAVLAMAIF
jgi:hypothetical protein